MQEIAIQLTWESLIPHIPIYTIGYGGRSIEQFLVLLKEYNIEFLADIRSQPYSRANQQFSKDALEQTLKNHQIRYIFMGDSLGGRPKDSSCYLDGKVDYSRVRERPFYQKGITHLHNAWEKQISVALMCAEIRPQECHRSKLIGNTLCAEQIDVVHIDETGSLKQQDDINRLLLGNQLLLFDNQQASIALNEKIGFSRKKYSLANEKHHG